MSDFVLRWTSLPNLHPAVVHLPIAFLPFALLLDVLALSLRPHRRWLDRAALTAHLAAALGAGAAYWAGRAAADALPPLAPAVQEAVNAHADAALRALWLVGLLAAWRALAGWLDWQVRRPLLRTVALPVAVLAVLQVGRTADLGGALVYREAVAVRVPETMPVAAEASPGRSGRASDPGERLRAAGDGAIEWTPVAGDGVAIGDLVRLGAGSDSSAVSEAGPAEEGGLVVQVSGQALLLLPGRFGDVEVDAQVGLSEFRGEVGLAHHAQGVAETGLMILSPLDGELRLLNRAGGQEVVLDRSSSAERLRATTSLMLSAAGRHINAFVDGVKLAHGHAAPLPEGSCGLYLRGSGRVRIDSLRAEPIGDSEG